VACMLCDVTVLVRVSFKERVTCSQMCLV
jgi:hypothetical protein